MNDAQRDLRPTANTEPAVKIIEQWIKLREARGLTREAAIAELNAASSAIAINLAHDGQHSEGARFDGLCCLTAKGRRAGEAVRRPCSRFYA
jgi:hypothetical protein